MIRRGKRQSFGRRAARVWVISKIRMIDVRPIVAMAMPASPQSCVATTVAIGSRENIDDVVANQIAEHRVRGARPAGLEARGRLCGPFLASGASADSGEAHHAGFGAGEKRGKGRSVRPRPGAVNWYARSFKGVTSVREKGCIGIRVKQGIRGTSCYPK